MNNQNKGMKIIIAVCMIVILLLISIGLSFAYFTAGLTGTEDITTISITGGAMDIVYAGGQKINAPWY